MGRLITVLWGEYPLEGAVGSLWGVVEPSTPLMMGWP